MTAPKPASGGMISGFIEGVRLLLRGFRLWGTRPRLMLLGLIPGGITLMVFVAAEVFLFASIGTISEWATPFAESWDEGWRTALRIAVGAALIAGSALILAYAFAVVTLAIGQPFFERISMSVDDALGSVVEGPAVPVWRSILRGIGEALAILAVTVLIGLGLFFVGLIPLVGTVTSACIGALVGGWFLALEITAVPFQRRGLSLSQRRALLRQRRSVTLGFGVAVFLLFLIPLGAVLAMPAAVAGGTVLARRTLGEATATSAVPATQSVDGTTG